MSESDSDHSTSGEVLAIMGRFFPFDSDGIHFAGETMVIKEMQNQSHNDEDGGTGLNVWDGAMLLARYLEKKPGIVEGKRVLELGSGCGLVGIAAAMLGAKEVVMTDLQYALPLMRENIERNRLNGEQQIISCKECDWFSPPAMSSLFQCSSVENGKESCPDVILVADCVWLSPLVTPLLETLKVYTSNQLTTVFITYQQRGRDVHDEFWQGIRELFEEVVEVDTERTVGLQKPDVFYVLECRRRKSNS